MLTRFAEIFTSILFSLEQVVAEKWAVWRQYLCRIAMNTGFSSLSKFYSALFLVLGMGARGGKTMGQRASPARTVVLIHWEVTRFW